MRCALTDLLRHSHELSTLGALPCACADAASTGDCDVSVGDGCIQASVDCVDYRAKQAPCTSAYFTMHLGDAYNLIWAVSAQLDALSPGWCRPDSTNGPTAECGLCAGTRGAACGLPAGCALAYHVGALLSAKVVARLLDTAAQV